MRYPTQRSWDRQERLVEAEGRAMGKYQTDLKRLRDLVAKYPDYARKFLRAQKST